MNALYIVGARVLEGERTLEPVLGWLERGFYRMAGIAPEREMSWRRYAVAMLGVGYRLAEENKDG